MVLGLNKGVLLASSASLIIGVKWFAASDGPETLRSATYPFSVRPRATTARVAVVGAGVGGCTAAYFLRQLASDSLEVHVFERDTVGGRTDVIEYDGHKYECGASEIHSSNRYLVDLAQKFGLGTLQSKDVPSTPAAIFNGKEFSLKLGTCGICTDVKLLFRYGLSAIRFQLFLKSSLKKFSNIYEIQSAGQTFTTVPDMLAAMGGQEYYQQTQISAQDYFVGKLGWSQRMIDELFTAALRVNYGQNATVDAFTTMVSMAGSESSSLWNVVGGNKQIAQEALKSSSATFHHSEVLSISRVQPTESTPVKYNVIYQDVGLAGEEKKEMVTSSMDFDAVILANPLTTSTVSFSNFIQPIYTPAATTPYHRTVATFIKGQLNPAFFGCDTYKSDFPFDIFTVASTPEEIGFPLCSVGLQIPSEATAETVSQYLLPVEDQPSRVWKLFSIRPLLPEEMERLFLKQETEAVAVDWQAYPEYSPPEQYPSFVLDNGVFYINTIEKCASAMEMAAIGAMNCSLLAWRYLSNTEQQ